MLGLVLYIILSIVMSTGWTIATCKETDLSELGLCSKICFALYFAVANLIAWPMYCIFAASVILHDEW